MLNFQLTERHVGPQVRNLIQSERAYYKTLASLKSSLVRHRRSAFRINFDFYLHSAAAVAAAMTATAISATPLVTEPVSYLARGLCC